MKSITMTVVLFAVSLLPGRLALAQDKPQGVVVSGGDLTQLYETPVIADGYNHDMASAFTQLYLRGGMVHALYASRLGSGGHLEGTWRLANNSLCHTFPMAITTPTERCVKIYKLDDGSYQAWRVDDGKLLLSYRMRRPQ